MSPQHEYFHDGKVIGQAELLPHKDTTRCDLFVIWVDAEHQNRGIGTALMTQICADADAEGVTLFLHCAPDPGRRDDLIRFYEKFGFVARDRRTRFPHMRRAPHAKARAA